MQKHSLMQTLQALDYIIFFSIETTHDQESFKFNYRKLFTDMQTDQLIQGLRMTQHIASESQTQFINDSSIFVEDQDFPNIIQIDWQSYDMKNGKVIDKESLIVKPANMPKIKQETQMKTGITQALIDEKGIPLSDAIKKFSQFIYEKLILENKSFNLVTFGDWILNYQLPIEATQKNINLGPHFAQYSNLLYIISEVYGPEQAAKIQSFSDLAANFKFDDDTLDIKLKSSYYCELMMRFFKEHLLKQYTTLVIQRAYSPTATYGQDEESKDQAQVEEKKGQQAMYSPSESKVRERSRSRSFERQRENGNNHYDNGYARISNLSDDTTEVDVLKAIPDSIQVQNIVFGKDGNDSKFCIIQLKKKTDAQDVLNLQIATIKDQEVKVEEDSGREFQQMTRRSRGGQGGYQRRFDNFTQNNFKPSDSSLQPSDYAALKMRGLPFSIRTEDILNFLKEFEFYQESIKIGKNSDGTKTGEGAVLFKNENDCKRAFQQKQGQNIGHRWIELYQITFADYLSFDESQQKKKTVKLSKYITENNISRVRKLRGLPYTATVDQICEFFSDYSVSKSDVVIEEINGKKTGFGLVFFSNEEVASQARREKNKQTIGNRYVEILECGPQDILQ